MDSTTKRGKAYSCIIENQQNLLTMPLILLILTVVSLAAYNRVLTNAHEQLVAKAVANTVFRKQVIMDGVAVGILEVLQHEEPADAVFQFAQRYGLDEQLRYPILEDICRQIKCERSHAILLKLPVSRVDGSDIGLLEIPEGIEPADVVQEFAAKNGLGEVDRNALIREVCSTVNCTRTSPLAWRKEVVIDNSTSVLIEVEEGREPADAIFLALQPFNLQYSQREAVFNEAKRDNVPYAREYALVYSQNIVANNETEYYSFELLDDGREPIDVLYEFVRNYTLEEYWEELVANILPVTCKLVSCNRVMPLLWSREIKNEEEKLLGAVKIYKGQEPIDAIDDFCVSHHLGDSFREQILKAACQELVCIRTVPVIYSKQVKGENGESFGTIEILEGEEIRDAMARFLFQTGLHNIEATQLIKTSIYEDACTFPRVKCTIESGSVESEVENVPSA